MSDAELVNMMNIEDLLEIFCYPFRTGKAISLHHGHVHLGALYSLHDECNPYVPMVELLHIPQTAYPPLLTEHWNYMNGKRAFPIETFGAEDTGWTRIELHRLRELELHTSGSSGVYHIVKKVEFSTDGNIERSWLAQANHCLPEHLFLTTGVRFYVTIWYPTDDIGLRGTFMAGAPMNDLYLFLFHLCVDVQDGLVSVQIPSVQDAYYWSFWPDGREPLSAELLDEVMPPQVVLEIHIAGKHWSQQDYQLIRDITLAKGLDPESSDLAIQLGCPLAFLYMVCKNNGAHTLQDTEHNIQQQLTQIYPNLTLSNNVLHCASFVGESLILSGIAGIHVPHKIPTMYKTRKQNTLSLAS
ncbi:hypothetical protein GGX14DRAFT_406063 [Mycena pura]|uniref:Uncharacterized protein n=1 Tax=Mycena pura TaxID=153505 RepID=A0AAD6URF0_9AGAR|nr:hypothetical protein GGX14DRAFT_406063 [Mycena pura]